ncbi:MAG: fumarylacetoacetate hydrolase family protein [Leucobacter sp.]
MRLATVRTTAGTRAAVQQGDAWVLLHAPDAGKLIARDGWREGVAAAATADAERLPLDGSELAAPLLRPGKVVCCGLNYRDHIAETGREVPRYPTLFAKFADTLTGPNDDIEVGGDSQKVDWEAELAVVIGAPLRRASRAEAEAAILGYTVSNDVSYRDWQSRTLQWFQGKAWDATTPIGPVVVTADEISPCDGLEIRCLVNDEVVQLSNTRELVFDAPDLVAYVSQFTRLAPGDIVLTGTPGGVGLGLTPQRFLRDGEVLTTSIEGIGTLVNRVSVSDGGAVA